MKTRIKVISENGNSKYFPQVKCKEEFSLFFVACLMTIILSPVFFIHLWATIIGEWKYLVINQKLNSFDWFSENQTDDIILSDYENEYTNTEEAAIRIIGRYERQEQTKFSNAFLKYLENESKKKSIYYIKNK